MDLSAIIGAFYSRAGYVYLKNGATGSITFQSTTRPTSNIQIGADDGSGGISVKTLLTEGGNSYTFTTTETVYLKTDATYNPEHNCYEVTAPITASVAGTEYNLGIGTIKVLVDGINDKHGLFGYNENNKLINFDGSSELIGKIVDVEVVDAKTWSLDGKYVGN